MPTEVIKLGANPIDKYYAYKAAVESSLDVISAILELVENGMDYGTDVSIKLNGTGLPNNQMELRSVVIEDNGMGMDHATVWERFRGAFHDSASHNKTSKSGRNGVGVKTNFQYWGQIEVQTTTKDFTPKKNEWKCKEENLDEIERTYQIASTVKRGSPDTEMRRYILEIDGTEAVIPWEECDRDISGTKVILKLPRGKVHIDVGVLIRRISHRIEFLDKLKNPENKATIHYRNENNKAMSKEIMPFYESDGKDRFVCRIKGNNYTDTSLLIQDEYGDTQPSKTLPANKNSILGGIDFDLKVLASESEKGSPNSFVLSICGANVYDIGSKRKNSVPPAVDFLVSQGNYTSSSGFSYRLHGYIKTNDERLKRALRHNKSVLDLEDKYALAFIEYITKELLKPLNDAYVASLERDSGSMSLAVRDKISQELNAVLRRRRERTQRKSPAPPENPTDKVLSKNKKYRCNDCLKVWRAPSDKNPSYCGEFNVDKEKGCGSRDIQHLSVSKTETRFNSVNVTFVDFLGGFIPARYEKDEGTVRIATLHPLFITPLRGQRKQMQEISSGIEQALFAIATSKAEEEERSFGEVYGEFLREWYEHRTDATKLKAVCKKKWEENNISIDDI